ncbi:MAG: hypothetical protein ABSG65_18600 [Bryobacteraceae bacterium]|jgi:hypothetical protein
MHLMCVLLALLAAPFWETKAPSDWTDAQIELLLHDSPWAEMAEPAPAVQVYLPSARPMREAEAELARRRGKPLNEEYVEYIAHEGANKLIVAIAYKNLTPLADEEEAHRMEEESIMRVGGRKYKMEGHFPPVPADPFLRLVYPREANERDKAVAFDLYLPGYGPYHEAEFRLRDMLYKGKLEM